MNPVLHNIHQPAVSPEIADAIRDLAKQDFERLTIVHCTQRAGFMTSWYCISPATYLLQQDGTRSKMLYHYNISMYPDIIYIKPPVTLKFTLVFAGLADSCTSFHLEEDPWEGYPFFSNEILRNGTDTYSMEVFLDVDRPMRNGVRMGRNR